MDRLTVEFEALWKVRLLNERRGRDKEALSIHTCCDYVDSLHYEDGRFGVTVFVEPCGDITKWGGSWQEVLDWWLAVFESQPHGWDYCRAGWTLLEVSERGLPDDAGEVWPGEENTDRWD